ncbi:DUF5050 domain-containing protein, partial [Tyzzerella sp. OttesenSCG-928-J15]|nr:DUF5050 domain-containing protein [Tyzzerella sp. OttesenSCG-928-J15]
EKADNFCLYEVNSEFNKSFFAVEFFPEDICKRDDETGYLIPSPEMQGEYEKRLQDFTSLIHTLKSSAGSQLIRVYRVIREDKDNYIFLYHKSESKPLKQYLAEHDGRLNYKQAYEFMLPITESLNRICRQNIFFKINGDNLYVSSFGSVEHSGFIANGYNVNLAVEDIGNVLYTMITGESFKKTPVKPSETGAELPVSLDNLLLETLSYNTAYTSIDEFMAKVKDAVLFDSNLTTPKKVTRLNERPAEPEVKPFAEAETLTQGEIAPPVYEVFDQAPAAKEESSPQPEVIVTPPPVVKEPEPYIPKDSYTPPFGAAPTGQFPPYTPPPAAYTPPAKQKKGCGGFLAGCVIGAFIMFVIMIFVVVAVANYVEESNYYSYSPEYSEAIAEEYYDFDEFDIPISDVAYTTYDSETALDGTACIYNGYIYYRTYIDGMGYALAESPVENPDEKNIIAIGVMPAYIVINNGFLYFADGFEDYHIYSVFIGEGSDYTIYSINNLRSAFLQADDNYVYFMNLEDDRSIYTVDLATFEVEPLISAHCHTMLLVYDKLIVSYDGQLISYNTKTGKEKVLVEDVFVYDDLFEHGGYVYYADWLTDSLCRVDLIDYSIEEGVYAVDYNRSVVNSGYLYRFDEDYNFLRVDLKSMEETYLNIEPEYYMVDGNYIFYYDYNDDFFIYNMYDETICPLSFSNGIS